MNAQERIIHFQKAYCSTLQKDAASRRYIKIPVANYTALNLFKHHIHNAITYMATLQADTPQDHEFGETMLTLLHILNHTHMYQEYTGLDMLLEE